VLAGKDNRAIAGLSMGGGHTIRTTLNNPSVFGYIEIFSAAAPHTFVLTVRRRSSRHAPPA
jgi:S-formylglutathione hydrolase FrmB